MENKPIVINEWYKSIGQSRYVGFEDMRFVDVDEYGVLKINKKLEAMTEVSDAVGSLVRWIDWGRISASAGRMFFVGSANNGYYNTSNGWTAITASQYSNGEGMVCWSGSNPDKSYMLVRDDGDLHALDCSSYASPSWDYDITTTLHDGTWGPLFIASNNKVYIANGNNVAELAEVDGQIFDPGNTATFTLNETRLDDLSSDLEIKCFEELNGDLLIGTGNLIKRDSAEIVVWDKSSSSYDRTIKISNVDGINMMIVYKNLCHVQAGNKGEWFVTNGGNVEKIAELPEGLIEENEYLTFYPQARAIIGNKLLFGISSGTSGLGLSGVWSIDLTKVGDPNNPIQKAKFEYPISTGEIGLNDTVNIGSIIPTQNQGFIVSWEDTENSSFGIDQLSNTGQLISSGAYVISAFYRIGGHQFKRTINRIELMLAKVIASGHSVTVSYRTDISASFTSLFTLSTAGEISAMTNSLKNKKDLTEKKNIQFKIELATGASATTGPEVLDLTLF